MQALWMILASLFFASMGVCVKFASSTFNSAELILYRGLIGIAFMWALARTRGISLATRFPGMHAWRSLIGVMSLGAWFYALAHLPLATAMTLNYMSSVWIAAFLVGGSLLLGRVQKQGPLVLTVMLGFVGVVLMLRPTFDHHQAFAGLLGLLSGMSAAFAYMQVMALSRLGEPETRVVFYFSVGSVVAGAAGMMAVGISPWVWPSALWLIPVGVLASLGQLCMTRAYSHGATLVVANLQYSGIVFAAIYSVTLFGDAIPLMGWVGMGLIVVSGIAATVLREHAVPHAPAEEH
ncbi:DMT family transporter [Rhodoferax sediminis]|jgi:drug/metabolite transporter (DMT)-like permease|uniref:DMT family transporter n=1 Tax=Rhodoferax sediminis TaxID=2509614 RepID=A0A515D993_9BURK|nr:DMT family transporter [Rhodoferax sediminis]QDL36979.1 DMT family transporter [Rhodoferax sediminis]